ncbi:hypothetical protein P3S67_031231 [Capsicum chacoense]
MEKIEHKMVAVNGINMHVAELGQGPTILFLHGFPELWSRRHQIVYLVECGYRAVAPDLRGYGDTTGAPVNDVSKFTIFHLVGDLVALLEAIAPNEDNVIVVAHDWGSIIAWHLCLFRPDKVRVLVNLSVHFLPRNPHMNLVEGFKSFFGEDHYVSRFQVFTSLMQHGALNSPCSRYSGCAEGGIFTKRLSEEELDYYVSKFEQTCLTGGVNYYRALPIRIQKGSLGVTVKVLSCDHEVMGSSLGHSLLHKCKRAQVEVPTKFIVGEFDLVYHIPGAKEYIHNGGFKKDVPLLEEVVVVEGAAHFVNQEKPDEINKNIYDFIQKF